MRTTLSAAIIFSILLIGCSSVPKKQLISSGSGNFSIEKYLKKELLTNLLADVKFDSTGKAIWKQNPNDTIQLPVSFDGNCHTNIDTVMYFSDVNQRKCAAIILTTYSYIEDSEDSTKTMIADCRSCGTAIGIALISENEDKTWKLYAFEKRFAELGYFGAYRLDKMGYYDEQAQPGKISLVKMGDRMTALKLTQGIGGNMGSLNGFESFYTIDQSHLKERGIPLLFNYDYYNSQIFIEVSDEPMVEKTEMKQVKGNGEYDDIELQKSGNKEKIEYYSYSVKKAKYIKK